MVGPIKNPIIPITPTRAIATDDAIPGVCDAAKIIAGNIGPRPKPAKAKPISTMMRDRS